VKLPYDPAQGDTFWKNIKKIQGYPGNHQSKTIGPMIFEEDALYGLPDLLKRMHITAEQTLLVVMDDTPMMRGDEELKPLVLEVLRGGGWNIEPLIFEPGVHEHVRTDMERIRKLESMLGENTAVLSLGSGSITDIVKHACFNYEQQHGYRPCYIAIPTANSMGAYTSNTATVYIRGVKRSLLSRQPDALVYDLNTLSGAPHLMTVSGAGDMLACLVSFSDWYIAHKLGLDPTYSEFQQELMAAIEYVFMDNADEIREHTVDGMSLEARFIAASSIGVSLVNASTPLSGYEHIMSHLIDQQSEFENKPLASHGMQVVLATLLVSVAYRYFLDNFNPAELDPDLCYPSAETMKKRIYDIFSDMDQTGEAAAECWEQYSIKLDAWHANRKAFASFLAEWPEHKANIEAYLRPPEYLARLLHRLGSPLSFEELNPPVSEEVVRFSFLHAPLIRRRLTLGDLLIFLDWDREALWEHVWRESQTVVKAART
jgi:glycerol-1-phosphate dehydrogenase [NAD(P)+]